MFNYGYQYGNQYSNQYGYQQHVQNQQQNGDSRIWVQGEVGAKAYLVAPGNTVDLWDSEQHVIWLKTVMLNGVPSMVKLNYSIDNPTPTAPNPAPAEDFVTRSEFEKRLAELTKVEMNSDE